MADTLVTSAELQKAFGRYREKALKGPVVITNHGRESLVLLSADEYRRLKSQDRRALYPWEMSERDVEGLLASDVAREAEAFDDEYAPGPDRR
jgi:prevent-host-death family protein